MMMMMMMINVGVFDVFFVCVAFCLDRCRWSLIVSVCYCALQVMMGHMHVVSGTAADKLDPSVIADCHTSSLSLSPSHSHATQAIHSQVDYQRTNMTFSFTLVLCELGMGKVD